jgi:hypothetical protein
MRMQNGGDLGLLRRLLREGLDGLQGEEPDRIACCWACGRLLQWCQYAELEGVDLRGLAGLLGDLGEPPGRMYPDVAARAVAADTARREIAAALVAAGGRVDVPEPAPRVVVV